MHKCLSAPCLKLYPVYQYTPFLCCWVWVNAHSNEKGSISGPPLEIAFIHCFAFPKEKLFFNFNSVLPTSYVRFIT